MILADCTVLVVGNPPPRHGGRYFILVKLTTACGITGLGEVYCATFGPDVVAAMIRDTFGRWFEGADPHRIEHLWRLTYAAGYTARPDASLVAVLSGLEIACWDILGKAAGKPVADLLGGHCRDRLRTYTYLYPADTDAHATGPGPSVYSDPDIAAEQAVAAVDLGFTAVKFDPCGPYTIHDGHQPSLEDLDRTERFVARLRDAVGPRADLLVGTHGQFTPSGARRMARRIEAYDPLWFEEPVPAERPEAMAEVARATAIPIATGERLVTKYEFEHVLAAGAASILQPALARVGGLWEAKKIAALAETRQAQIAPHHYCGPVAAAANIQYAATLPNFLILETIGPLDGFAYRLVTGLTWADGYAIPSREPGLGVTLDEDLARAHPYTGTDLHLGMLPSDAGPT